MTMAWANEAVAKGAALEHAEPFYMSAEFWVFVAFIMLVSASGKLIYTKVTTALDARSGNIKQQIEEATKLHEEAQEMLASFKRKQHDAANEAIEINQRSENEAKRLTDQAAKDLEKSLERREQLAMERISQAETKAIEEVRTTAVDVTINAARRLLGENISSTKAAAIIDDAIDELPKKLN